MSGDMTEPEMRATLGGKTLEERRKRHGVDVETALALGRVAVATGRHPTVEVPRTLKERANLEAAIGWLSMLAEADGTLLNAQTREAMRLVLAEVERLRAEREALQRIIDGYDRTPAEARAARAEQDARTAYSLYRAEQSEHVETRKAAGRLAAVEAWAEEASREPSMPPEFYQAVDAVLSVLTADPEAGGKVQCGATAPWRDGDTINCTLERTHLSAGIRHCNGPTQRTWGSADPEADQ